MSQLATVPSLLCDPEARTPPLGSLTKEKLALASLISPVGVQLPDRGS
jgi:hypothetical protein